VNEDLNALFLELTGARSGREMARAIGIDATTLNRRLRSEPPVQTVVAICRAYRLNVVQVFVRVGYITASEAAEGAVASALQSASDEQLAEEMLRRVREGSAGTAITEPMDANVGSATQDDGAEDFDVDLDTKHLAHIDFDLAAKRGQKKSDEEHAE
jgi:hypothetical protein